MKNITINNKKIYKSIKEDNLQEFINAIDKFPLLINFKNKQKNNLLFYCLDKKSYKIFNYLFNKMPELLLENNQEGVNCFANLIKKDKLSAIISFLDIATPKMLDALSKSKDNDNNTLLMQFISKNYYPIYDKFFSINRSELSDVNNHGYSVLHLIARHNALYTKDILNNELFTKEHYFQTDNNGITPFLLACKYSDYELFNIFQQKSDIYAKSILDSDALHFCAYSNNKDKTDFLLNLGFNPENKNKYSTSALNIALSEKNMDCAHSMLKKTQSIDEVQLLAIIKNSNAYPLALEFIINNTHLLNNNILTNPQLKEKIAASIFYYCPIETIENNNDFLNLFLDINPKTSSMLLFSAIAGRRNFIEKSLHIINKWGWVSGQNKNFSNFSKAYPIGYLSALSQLPKTQFEALVDKAEIINYLKDQDLLIFTLLCINKESSLYHSILNKIDENKKQFSNNNLIFLNNISNEKIISHLESLHYIFKDIPDAQEILIDKVSRHIYYDESPIAAMTSVFKMVKDNKFKRHVYINLNKFFLQENLVHPLEIIFNKKNSVMQSVLNIMLTKEPLLFKNKDYVTRQKISIKAAHYLNYLTVNNFQSQAFLPINNVDNFYDYFFKQKLNSTMNISDEFATDIFTRSPFKLKVQVLDKFLKYSLKNHNLSLKFWENSFSTLSINSQKILLKNFIPNFLKEENYNPQLWQFIQKKYKAVMNKELNFSDFFSNQAISLNMLKNNLMKKYINIFDCHMIQKYENITLLKAPEFAQVIETCSNHLPEFTKKGLNDFLIWDDKINTIFRGHFFLLNTILKNTQYNFKDYKKIINKVEAWLLTDPTVVTDKSYQSIINHILLSNDTEVIKYLLHNNIIDKAEVFLTSEQNSLILKHKLSLQLNMKPNAKIVVKI